MSYPTRKPSKRPARRPKVVDAAFIEGAALSYLDRFDATAAKLRDVLLRRCRMTLRRQPSQEAPTETQLAEWIDSLITRYLASGLVDDRRYAESAVAGLRARGGSRRGIVMKLRQKGVPDEVIDQVMEGGAQHQDELDAARKLVKRRRLGHLRREENWQEHRRKDLAKLARAGFSFDVAARALAPEEEEF